MFCAAQVSTLQIFIGKFAKFPDTVGSKQTLFLATLQKIFAFPEKYFFCSCPFQPYRLSKAEKVLPYSPISPETSWQVTPGWNSERVEITFSRL